MGITEIFLNYYQYFLRGTQTTVIVSLITVLLGTVLGCLIALLRLSRFRLCSGFAKLYITVIRGTPLLVQLYIVYYQLHFIPWPEGSILGVELAPGHALHPGPVHELHSLCGGGHSFRYSGGGLRADGGRTVLRYDPDAGDGEHHPGRRRSRTFCRRWAMSL